MKISPETIILGRLSRELAGLRSVGLGEGLPRRVRSHLEPGTKAFFLSDNGRPNRPLDAVVVEALQISDSGDLVAAEANFTTLPDAAHWIVATSHTLDDGQPKLVRECSLPLSRSDCIRTIITELGVIRISDVGLVLTEVAPGVSTDEIKLKTNASLHIADDIRLMEF